MSVPFNYKIRPTMHLIRNGNILCGKDGAAFTDLSKVRNHIKPCQECLLLATLPTENTMIEMRAVVSALGEYIESMPQLNKHRLRLEVIQNKMEKILNK